MKKIFITFILFMLGVLILPGQSINHSSKFDSKNSFQDFRGTAIITFTAGLILEKNQSETVFSSISFVNTLNSKLSSLPNEIQNTANVFSLGLSKENSFIVLKSGDPENEGSDGDDGTGGDNGDNGDDDGSGGDDGTGGDDGDDGDDDGSGGDDGTGGDDGDNGDDDGSGGDDGTGGDDGDNGDDGTGGDDGDNGDDDGSGNDDSDDDSGDDDDSDDDSDDDNSDDDDSDDDDNSDDDDSDDDDNSDDDDSDDDSGDDDDSDDDSDDDNSDDDDSDDDDSDDDDSDDDDSDDDDLIIDGSRYFVALDPNISQDSVDLLLEELNSYEIADLKKIGIRLWAVKGFPYFRDTLEITNINGHIVQSRRKTKINDATFNVAFRSKEATSIGNAECFNPNNLHLSGGNEKIVLSIFDTGISSSALSNGLIPVEVDMDEAFDYTDMDQNPEDENGHGTEIASLIANVLSQNNVTNVILDIRKTHNKDGFGYVSDIILAMLDAIDENVDIINMSYSYSGLNADTLFQPLFLAIRYAEENDVMVITSASNEGINNDVGMFVNYPASYPNNNIIAVTSNNCFNEISPFASFGQKSIDYSFFGENIPVSDRFGNLQHRNGTSYSTALMSAYAAIVATNIHDLNAGDLKCVLSSAVVPTPGFKSKVVTGGIFNPVYLENFDYSGNLCKPKAYIGELPVEPVGRGKLVQLNVSPSPFRSSINFELGIEEPVLLDIKILNAEGQVRKQYSRHYQGAGDYITLDDLADLPNGLYHIICLTQNNIYSTKIIKI